MGYYFDLKFVSTRYDFRRHPGISFVHTFVVLLSYYKDSRRGSWREIGLAFVPSSRMGLGRGRSAGVGTSLVRLVPTKPFIIVHRALWEARTYPDLYVIYISW
jgi:hypothetical protein